MPYYVAEENSQFGGHNARVQGDDFDAILLHRVGQHSALQGRERFSICMNGKRLD